MLPGYEESPTDADQHCHDDQIAGHAIRTFRHALVWERFAASPTVQRSWLWHLVDCAHPLLDHVRAPLEGARAAGDHPCCGRHRPGSIPAPGDMSWEAVPLDVAEGIEAGARSDTRCFCG